jgi:tetratricopeptide (TPR) repeat protein
MHSTSRLTIQLAIVLLLPAAVAAQGARRDMALGRSLADSGRWADAARAFRSATRADSTNAAAWSALGSSLNRIAMYVDALDAMERAVRLDSSSTVYRYNRALVYSEVGRFADAIRDLDIVVVERPGLAAAWTERGTARASMGDLQGARRDWARAIELDSTYVWPRYYRGLWFVVEGDFAAAIDDLEETVRRTRFPNAMLWRWIAHGRAGRPTPDLPLAGSDWPMPIAAFLAGSLSEEALLDEARRQAVQGDDRRLVSANLFIAQHHLVGGRPSQARLALVRATRAKSPRHAEAAAAQAALDRLPP